MFNPSAFLVRPVEDADAPTLAWLSRLGDQPPVARPALLGHIDGMPAAAISLVDGRVTADPFQPTAELAQHLRLQRSGWRATGHTPALAARLRAAIAFAARPAPRA